MLWLRKWKSHYKLSSESCGGKFWGTPSQCKSEDIKMNKNRMHIETDKESLSNKYRGSQGKGKKNINRMNDQMYHQITFLSLKILETTFQKISPNQRQK